MIEAGCSFFPPTATTTYRRCGPHSNLSPPLMSRSSVHNDQVSEA